MLLAYLADHQEGNIAVCIYPKGCRACVTLPDRMTCTLHHPRTNESAEGRVARTVETARRIPVIGMAMYRAPRSEELSGNAGLQLAQQWQQSLVVVCLFPRPCPPFMFFFSLR